RVVYDVRKEPEFLNRTGARARDGDGPLSFVCVPLRVESRTIGAISVDKRFVDEATVEKDKRLLTIVACIIAQALRISELVKADKEELLEENFELRQGLKANYKFENIVGVSGPMHEVFEATALVAKSKAAVLIRGETGTGKELIARAIHYNSARANQPFVRVNCAALAETLLESELFGHVRGAFTSAVKDRKGLFEVAHTGTIFLDEVGDMSPGLQAKVLRVLQEGEFERVGDTQVRQVDVRLIAATNKNLEEEMRKGRFREDLYYRLNVVPIYIPPLRERKEDIPLLIEFFLKRFNVENSKNVGRISKSTLDLLMAYPWPGNVRELQSCVEKVVVFSQGEEFAPDALPISIKAFAKEQRVVAGPRAIADLVEAVASSGAGGGIHEKVIGMVEEAMIRRALAQANGVQLEAAKALGISRNTLRKKVLDYRISANPPTRQ
ncbi:MAG: AAA family ATPase, partial [Planctomycetes bacterium]|nr:AAA family ATPase [Planctomycetota bacterium]